MTKAGVIADWFEVQQHWLPKTLPAAHQALDCFLEACSFEELKMQKITQPGIYAARNLMLNSTKFLIATNFKKEVAMTVEMDLLATAFMLRSCNPVYSRPALADLAKEANKLIYVSALIPGKACVGDTGDSLQTMFSTQNQINDHQFDTISDGILFAQQRAQQIKKSMPPGQREIIQDDIEIAFTYFHEANKTMHENGMIPRRLEKRHEEILGLTSVNDYSNQALKTNTRIASFSHDGVKELVLIRNYGAVSAILIDDTGCDDSVIRLPRKAINELTEPIFDGLIDTRLLSQYDAIQVHALEKDIAMPGPVTSLRAATYMHEQGISASAAIDLAESKAAELVEHKKARKKFILEEVNKVKFNRAIDENLPKKDKKDAANGCRA